MGEPETMIIGDVALYHIGGKVKIELESGEMVEDYMDDCSFYDSATWTYRVKLRKHGTIFKDIGDIIEWSAE